MFTAHSCPDRSDLEPTSGLASDLRAPVLPADVGVGMGWLGQYMYIRKRPVNPHTHGLVSVLCSDESENSH